MLFKKSIDKDKKESIINIEHMGKTRRVKWIQWIQIN